MLTFFRNFFKSKVGVVVTLGFLGLIALAFASMDISSTGVFGGVSGGDRVALVGDRRISTSDLSTNVSNEVEQLRQQNPTLTIQSFAAEGGVASVLQRMISRWSIAEFAERLGLRAGDRLVDSEIVSIPAFRGVDGKFSQEAFRSLLTQRGLSENAVREDLAMGLMARQLITPAALASRMPTALSRRYAQLLGESRSGAIAPIPAEAFAPTGDPTDAQLQAYYGEHQSRFIRPERRVLRYAVFDEASLGTQPAPTQAQIAARYERDKAQYAALEMRGLTQLVVPTQAAAQALANEVAGGKSLEAAARAKGLASSQVEELSKADLTSRTSQAVANAAFAAAQGALSAPAQGPLGWYVMRVDKVSNRPGKPLAQVSGEIAEQLRVEQRRQAFSTAAEAIDDGFADGRSLSDIADEYKLKLTTTQPITADGRVYGKNETAPIELAPVLELAFDVDEGDPQLAETVAGESLVLFEVGEITASAPAPLAEIRDDVTLSWRRDEGMKAAGEAAARILKRVEGGSTLAAAVAAETAKLPQPQNVTLNRRELAQQQQVTPTTMLFFSMAEGTTKRIEQGPSSAWFVVSLDKITTPEIANDDPLVAATRQQLSRNAGEEYTEQLVRAIQQSLKVETNQSAVDAVIAQLTGQNQQ
ncbi:peptidylprolyl isomerase [Aurantiacibacter xanthus]|uniref:Parvulin-like PPIase n=1 Tax=Aurantiacibacter xanthus TaxID=1784712 RepID=A0A3A1PA87_9SPHN|nr:SurA N-terminal domain-containing protein [Aurantiacibacter xanthus]RIV90677.1 peptidylprolyl isomerase [Aurantiacibacter xanthus]